MSATLFGNGPLTKSRSRDAEGYREYTCVHLVKTTDPLDGPQVVAACPNIPQVGDMWAFGNDYDPWATCWPTQRITVHQEKEGDAARYWRVESMFSTKPRKRCQDTEVEDPLMEPQKVSGSFVKYTEEATKDRTGQWIVNSSHEPIRGSQVEFDKNRPTVKIEQNVYPLGLSTFSAMIDGLNDSVLWGLNPRCIKLSNVSWERKIYGSCYYYYTRTLEFDIRYDTFDRTLYDEGTKVLNGHWGPTGLWVLDNINGSAPDPNNPTHYNLFVDKSNNPCRVILDGNGQPAENISGLGTGSGDDPGVIHVEKYTEVNFLLLGIPTVFDI